MKIKELAKKYDEYIIKVRRHLHENAEPTWEEIKTTEFLDKELQSMGIKTQRFDKTGVVGFLEGGKPGKTIALRADIDALAIKEEADVPFKCTNGNMHACGHDAHAAMLLGAAKILTEIKDKLSGNVKFIFQPAEERCEGSRYLIKNGVLEGVDAIFGMHIWGNYEVGKFNAVAGPRLSSGDIFTIKIKGKSAHGSQPHLGSDAIVAAASVIMNIQSLVSRIYDPMEPTVVTIGTINGGKRFNIIANEVVLEGTTRTFSREIVASFEDDLRRIVESTCSIYDAEGSLDYIHSTTPIINDEKLSKIAENAAVKLYGKDTLSHYPMGMGCDDFALYTDHVPGVFGALGGGNKEIGAWFSNHDEKFVLDESAFHRGSAVMSQFVVDFLNEN